MSIIVGYTPNPEGRAALERAIHEARSHGAPLLVANIGDGESYADSRLMTADDLDSLRVELEGRGVPFEVRQISQGQDVAEQLAALAEEAGADLLVIGMRRRSAVGKFILGSTAQRILLSAEVPVLSVKAGS